MSDLSDILVHWLYDQHMRDGPIARPCSLRFVKSLKQFKVAKGGEFCTICLEAYQDHEMHESVLVDLPCKHRCHWHCISEWFKTNHTCPVCRTEFEEQSVEEKHRLRVAEIEEQLYQIMLDGAAAAAAGCPGSPMALFDMPSVSNVNDIREEEPRRFPDVIYDGELLYFVYHHGP